MYSIRVPRSDLVSDDIEQLAQITWTFNNKITSVYWIKTRDQVLLEHDGEWYIQPNGSILQSIASIYHVDPWAIKFNKIIVGNKYDFAGSAVLDKRVMYPDSCPTWSSYKSMNLIMHADMTIDMSD